MNKVTWEPIVMKKYEKFIIFYNILLKKGKTITYSKHFSNMIDE